MFAYFPFGKDTFTVNSWHHQGLKDISAYLKVVAKSYDGLAEAVVMDKTFHPFMIAVQFHPERLPKRKSRSSTNERELLPSYRTSKKISFTLVFISKSTNFADHFVKDDRRHSNNILN